MSRVMSVAGSFYPASCKEIEDYIGRFNDILKQNGIDIKRDAKAIIAPHAGYIYSGFTANIAYQAISNKPKRVVVIGPSHRVYFEGVSIVDEDSYLTPCGELLIDKDLTKKLLDEYPFANYIKDAHFEHSTETQMPFVKEYFKDVKVVEMVYGKISYKLLSLLVDEILKLKDTLLVISTDLSHFYDIKKAKSLDSICVEAIVSKDLELFDKGCEACGIIGVKALVSVAKKSNLTIEFLDYRTSFDVTKDAKSVVGYSSFLVF